MIPFFLGVRS